MKKPTGFTLIEVLVSLTLLSMIMVATIAAMRTLGNTRTTIGQVTNRVDEVRVFSEFFRNSIGGALPVLREGSSEEDFLEADGRGTFFGGDSGRLVWVSPFVAGADLGGAFLFSLAHVEGALELRWQPYQSDLAAVNWGEYKPRVLLQSVEEFELGYLARYGGEWLEEWPGAEYNPVAVRMNIQSGGRYWPELVIRLSGSGLSE